MMTKNQLRNCLDIQMVINFYVRLTLKEKYYIFRKTTKMFQFQKYRYNISTKFSSYLVNLITNKILK